MQERMTKGEEPIVEGSVRPSTAGRIVRFGVYGFVGLVLVGAVAASSSEQVANRMSDVIPDSWLASFGLNMVGSTGRS